MNMFGYEIYIFGYIDIEVVYYIENKHEKYY